MDNTIDINKLQQRDIYELLKLAFLLDEKAFVRAFDNAGVTIIGSDEDIQTLARLSNSGGDELGVLKNNFGNKIIFSVVNTLANIKSDYTNLFKEKKSDIIWK